MKWILMLALAVAVLVAAGVTAEGPNRVRNCADCPIPNAEAPALPSLGSGGHMRIVPDETEATSVLQLDDGSCEGGLGAGVVVTSFQQFNVPTQCTMGGLDIIAVTSRMNTNAAQSFAFAQDGPAPAVGGFTTTPAAFAASGPCPSTSVSTVGIGTGNVITGTGSFWAGLVNTGFAGRDSGTPGNVWLNCAACGMTQYSPAELTGLGLGGTWMIRVTVEDQNCVPVELLGVSID
ncbi:MAG: hypothetical protein R2991_16050 [Thermoanaerobaculia bacterium]